MHWADVISNDACNCSASSESCLTFCAAKRENSTYVTSKIAVMPRKLRRKKRRLHDVSFAGNWGFAVGSALFRIRDLVTCTDPTTGRTRMETKRAAYSATARPTAARTASQGNPGLGRQTGGIESAPRQVFAADSTRTGPAVGKETARRPSFKIAGSILMSRLFRTLVSSLGMLLEGSQRCCQVPQTREVHLRCRLADYNIEMCFN